MRMTVKKWGNSAAVRIPAAIMDVARLSIDQAVDVRLEGGRIIIEPILDDGIAGTDLETLLAGVTDENRHDSVDFGPAVGKEVW
ncbi:MULTISPECIES: AbrB/MazE/SpoVT family DNA-binding domain-containing protein [Inquilinus]|uniref:Antitoxin MazE n=1 Tax=Inquilinus ginsengisoli TaxID=363840 RepID=A0ABU1JRU4_9PROT|nr:AbrB/MazE/SpoVT family DNA-binding domain-containing protein [Inquilinus ginsengisoli]MDR6291322.1 antitoxin MazE [Inquilinus ginsengisoli]